jgi:hypothetical protein
MAHPAYLRDKARTLRVERRLSIDEIAERLALPKTTIFYWVRDLPLNRPRRANPGQRRGNLAMKRKWRLLREAAYDEGWNSFALLAEDPTFRDFVCMYIGEGYKRDRNVVSIGNSDPRVVALSALWIRRFTKNRISYELQYHADQNLRALCSFWALRLGIEPAAVSAQRKSNSGQLSGRTWRSKYGVLSVKVGDTMLRARLQAWMDCLQGQWLDSPRIGA